MSGYFGSRTRGGSRLLGAPARRGGTPARRGGTPPAEARAGGGYGGLAINFGPGSGPGLTAPGTFSLATSDCSQPCYWKEGAKTAIGSIQAVCPGDQEVTTCTLYQRTDERVSKAGCPGACSGTRTVNSVGDCNPPCAG